MSQGNLYILSAPSGAGKSSLISALLASDSSTQKWFLCHIRPVPHAQVKLKAYTIILYQRRV